MNDGTSGTHADTEALEAERKTDTFPGEPDAQGGEPGRPIDVTVGPDDAEHLDDIDESIKRAAW